MTNSNLDQASNDRGQRSIRATRTANLLGLCLSTFVMAGLTGLAAHAQNSPVMPPKMEEAPPQEGGTQPIRILAPLPNKIECRFQGNPKLGIRFFPTETNKVKLQGFNEENNTTEMIEPDAEFDDSFSDSQIYIRYHTRNEEAGLYSEYLLARFWPGGRKINPGLMQVTEASYSKSSDGKEVEELHPLGRAALTCTEIKN